MKIAILFAASALALGACGSAAPIAPITPANQATVPKVELPRLTSAEDFDYTAEFTGAVRLGGSIDEVIAKFGEPESVTDPEEMAATGEWVRTYSWESLGLTVMVAGESPEGPFSISSLTIGELSNVRTIRDIGIGSTRDEVEAAYSPAINLDESNGNALVVGSIYGGITFVFEPAVSLIIVGAGAE